MRDLRKAIVAVAAGVAVLAATGGAGATTSDEPAPTPDAASPETTDTTAPEGAAPVADTGGQGEVGEVIIAAAGADATLQLFDVILTGPGQYNIPTLPDTPFVVPGDANCSEVAYVKATPGPGQAIAPPSAGVGLNLLKAQATNAPGQRGCLDIARSSNAPRGVPTDNAGFEFYAFSLDAVSWASPSLAAPATLTKAQLKDIYACNITDWSQIPGAGSGPIQRYFTQVGSGVGSFFQSDLLDGQDPFSVSSPSCPAPKRIQQSHGNFIDPADREKAITPYGVGAWTFQANNSVNPTLDIRGGVRLGGITTAGDTPIRGNAATWNSADEVYQLDTAGVVNESNVKLVNSSPAYPGVRYLFNTIDTVSPNYAEAAALVGFTNVPSGAKSPLCSGAHESAILSFGFAPLSSSGNPKGTSNLAGATCRKYTN